MRRAYVAQIGPTVLYPYYRFDHRRWRVAAFRVVLAVVPEQLYDLAKIGLPREHILNSATIEHKAVSRELKAMLFRDALLQLGEKRIRGSAVTFADRVRRNQLCLAVHCNKHPGIAKFRGVVNFQIAVFL